MELRTERLTLIAATMTSARAACTSQVLLGELLGCTVPENWPPDEMREAEEYFAKLLENRPELAGRAHWYWIRTEDTVLIGCGGFGGNPNAGGDSEMGYSVLPQFYRNGYGTEAVGALANWALKHEDVRRVTAVAQAPNTASIRVLEKSGFRRTGRAMDGEEIEFELTRGT